MTTKFCPFWPFQSKDTSFWGIFKNLVADGREKWSELSKMGWLFFRGRPLKLSVLELWGEFFQIRQFSQVWLELVSLMASVEVCWARSTSVKSRLSLKFAQKIRKKFRESMTFLVIKCLALGKIYLNKVFLEDAKSWIVCLMLTILTAKKLLLRKLLYSRKENSRLKLKSMRPFWTDFSHFSSFKIQLLSYFLTT